MMQECPPILLGTRSDLESTTFNQSYEYGPLSIHSPHDICPSIPPLYISKILFRKENPEYHCCY